MHGADNWLRVVLFLFIDGILRHLLPICCIIDLLPRIKFQNLEHHLWFICTLDHKFTREKRNLLFEENGTGRERLSLCLVWLWIDLYFAMKHV